MPITEIVALSGVIEKLSIIGVLVIICFVLAWAMWRFRKELIATHIKLEKAKQALLVVKVAADKAGVEYDLSSIRDMNDLLGDGQ
jgi:hypothetical protein